MTITDHTVHDDHAHAHGPDCGHVAVDHDGHIDYIHDGHAHSGHDGHYDEHPLPQSSTPTTATARCRLRT